MHVNIQMLRQNYTSEHNNIAIYTCRKNHCDYNIYKSGLQQMYYMDDSNSTSSITVGNVIVQNGGKRLVEL